jgi:hypothetical protein
MRHKHSFKIVFVALVIYCTFFVSAAQATEPIHQCRQWHSMLRRFGLPVQEFTRIMYRESRCTPRAIGWNYHAGKSYKDCKLTEAAIYKRCKAVKSYDSGLLQINSSWVTVTAQTCKSKRGDLSVLLIPSCNLKVAAVLYNKGKGMGNWRATSSSRQRLTTTGLTLNVIE